MQIVPSSVKPAMSQSYCSDAVKASHHHIGTVCHAQDTITINHRFSNDHLIKLSISHALSQSTKLCVFEERVIMIVMNTKDLPGTLAATGACLHGRPNMREVLAACTHGQACCSHCIGAKTLCLMPPRG